MATPPVQVLLVEDNPVDVRLLTKALQSVEGEVFHVTCVQTVDEAGECLRAARFDVVLLDLSLTDSQGLETLTRVRNIVPETPIVVLTGLQDEAVAIRAAHAGAQDYLVKGEFPPQLLARSMRYAIERRRIENALQASERQLRTVFESSLSGFVMTDDAGRYVEANPAACEVFGLSREELLGRSVAEFVVSGFDFHSAWETFRERGDERGLFQLQRPDGEVRIVEYSATTDVLPGRHLSELRDVTQRVRAEEALRTREAQFRTTLELLPVGVWLAGPDGTLLYSNGEAQRIWGGARYVGMEGFGEFHAWWPDAGRPVQAGEWALTRAIRAGERVLGQVVEIEGFDGVRRVILNSAVPIQHDGDEIRGAVVLNEDITAQRRAEQERQRLLESERQKSEQLALAVREAHHRIKNNLQAISDLLSLELASGNTPDPAEALRDSVERIQAIATVHDLLSQYEDVETVDASQVVGRLVPMVLHSSGVPEGTVRLEMDLTPVRLSSKKATVLALITNELVSNAAKHAFRSGTAGELRVTLQLDGDHALLRIHDSGPGLPPGFDLRRHVHVGLEVVQMMAARDLNGSFRLLSEGGTLAEVVFQP